MTPKFSVSVNEIIVLVDVGGEAFVANVIQDQRCQRILLLAKGGAILEGSLNLSERIVYLLMAQAASFCLYIQIPIYIGDFIWVHMLKATVDLTLNLA